MPEMNDPNETVKVPMDEAMDQWINGSING